MRSSNSSGEVANRSILGSGRRGTPFFSFVRDFTSGSEGALDLRLFEVFGNHAHAGTRVIWWDTDWSEDPPVFRMVFGNRLHNACAKAT